MDTYTLIGLREVDFVGSDQKRVQGMTLYFTFESPEIDGHGCDHIFVTDRRFNSFSFVPSVGGKCRVVYNKYGKVADLVKA